MYEELEEIRQKCLTCHKCILGSTRTNIVFSDGIPNDKLVLVLPHPSPLNKKWLKDHPKFEKERLIDVSWNNNNDNLKTNVDLFDGLRL